MIATLKPTGKTIPRTSRIHPELLGKLLTRTRVFKAVLLPTRKLVISWFIYRTVRQNIERYRGLIEQ